MRGVVRENTAADAGDDATDGHRRDLHGGNVDAAALRGELVLADRTQHSTGTRPVQPPDRSHHQGDHCPNEKHDVKRRPAMFRKIADLAEALGSMRSEHEMSGLHLIGEIEEEQTHRLSECYRGNHQHQALDAQGRESDRARYRAGDNSGSAKRRDDRPLRKHRQHAGDIGADSEETGLRETNLAGEQDAVGRQAKYRMNADDLQESEIEVHRLPGSPSVAPSRHREKAARAEYEENEQEQHDVKIAFRYATKKLEQIFKTADDKAGHDCARDAPQPADYCDDQSLDG